MFNNCKNGFTVLITGLLILTALQSIQVTAITADIDVEHEIELVYDCPDARKVVLSGKYLYLQNGEQEIILIENSINRSSFRYDGPVHSFTAINRTLIFSTVLPNASCHLPALFTTGFDDYSNPQILSNMTFPLQMDLVSLNTHNQFVYAAQFEWGFPVLNYSNILEPRIEGYIALNSWHSYQVYIISNFGFFGGDWRNGIFDLDSDPVQPSLLKTIDLSPSYSEYEYPLMFGGRPAVSDKFLAINYRSPHHEICEIHVIPRVNATALGEVYKTDYITTKGYTDLGLVNDSILVIASETNVLSLFEITADRELDFLDEIDLGTAGSIEAMYQINGTNEFYIANGAGGLLKLSLFITPKPAVAGFHFDLIVITAILLYFTVTRRRSHVKI